MLTDAFIAATVVREAMANIVELLEQVAASMPGSDAGKFRSEANETVLALMAHLITADGKYDPLESAFLKQLVDFGQGPNAELNFLRQHTERWRVLERKVPDFFRTAVESDVKNNTDMARSIMREIQLIANNCSVSDRHFADVEMKIIQRYLRFLDDYLEQKTGGSGTWLEP